ncbi:MAG TPA: branched-chain amino acid ABC transporter substrate-binding protein [Ktedonobacterales bacterium]
MQRNRLWRTMVTSSLAITALTAFSLAGCGPGGNSASKVIKIGTSLAVSGGDASAQLPAQYGADLAISQNKDLGSGYTLEVVHKNYEGQSGPDANIGQADITALQNDPQVMAVVGPFNSGVAKQEIPVANAGSGPVLISPANTNPGLTLEQYAQEAGVNFAALHPAGKPNFYFRIPANDFLQGKADAQIALTATPLKPAAKTAFVVDDNTTYGKPLADFFTQFFTQGGGTTVGTRTSITSDNLSVLPQLASAIVASKADTVFYGGVTSQGGCKLKKALVQAGYTKPMVGGDGIATDPGCISDAGAASVGLIATVAAPDPSTLTGDKVTKLKTDYTTFVAGKPSNDFTPYAAQSYDAAMVAITAIKGLISANKTVTRLAVRDAIAGLSYSGATGNISFDANGDNAGTKVFSVYAVLPGTTTWAYQTAITY